MTTNLKYAYIISELYIKIKENFWEEINLNNIFYGYFLSGFVFFQALMFLSLVVAFKRTMVHGKEYAFSYNLRLMFCVGIIFLIISVALFFATYFGFIKPRTFN